LEELDLQHFDKGANVNSLFDLVKENRISKSDELMDFIKVPPVSELIVTKPINLDIIGEFI